MLANYFLATSSWPHRRHGDRLLDGTDWSRRRISGRNRFGTV